MSEGRKTTTEDIDRYIKTIPKEYKRALTGTDLDSSANDYNPHSNLK